MTEKLYYVDAYIKEFDAEVLSVERCDDKFAVVLSKTAFFPEEGGQSSDSGYIGNARVIKVYEENGVIRHLALCEDAVSHGRAYPLRIHT